MDVKLTADLGSTRVSLRQVANLKVGDIIPLDIPENINAHIDGVNILECKYGIQGGRYALRVEQFIHPEDTEINLIASKLGVKGEDHD